MNTGEEAEKEPKINKRCAHTKAFLSASVNKHNGGGSEIAYRRKEANRFEKKTMTNSAGEVNQEGERKKSPDN